MCGVEKERSGEEGLPEVGRRVCSSVLRRTRSESTRESWMESPLLAAVVGGGGKPVRMVGIEVAQYEDIMLGLKKKV